MTRALMGRVIDPTGQNRELWTKVQFDGIIVQGFPPVTAVHVTYTMGEMHTEVVPINADHVSVNVDENEKTEAPQRTAWWGNCRTCFTILAIATHDDSPLEIRQQIADGPQQGDWDDIFPDCPVCGGSVDFEGSDPLPFRIG